MADDRVNVTGRVPAGSPEFDRFAPNYDAGMDDPIKRLAGGDAESFVTLKAEWFLRFHSPHGRTAATPRLLDFGCGAGMLMRVLRRLRFAGTLEGCDPSPRMLDEARRVWDGTDVPELSVQEGEALPYANGRFDYAIASAVFHHIEPDDRDGWIRELLRVLKPHGYLIVFEHNPWNPVTRFMVSRAPIDANAVLLASPETATRLRQAGFEGVTSSGLMYFPPRLRFLRPLERALSWLPLGGQYATVGQRPGP